MNGNNKYSSNEQQPQQITYRPQSNSPQTRNQTLKYNGSNYESEDDLYEAHEEAFKVHPYNRRRSNADLHNQQMQHSHTFSYTSVNTTSNHQQSPQYQSVNRMMGLNPEDRVKYIEKLESEFDQLMKHKQQLDAQLTRLPYKATNTTMHTIRENIESELNLVEKKLHSTKLELRKLNILKTH